MKIKFTKCHGLGNDFVLINCYEHNVPDLAQKAKQLCDRRFGIGCDQLLVLRPSEIADVRMQIFNADGGEVEMCGNGIRCLAQYVHKHKIVNHDAMTVETLGGIKKPRLEGNLVEVDMGEPILKGPEIPVQLEGMVIGKNIEIKGTNHSITCVSMGNPHCVFFLEDVEKAPVSTLGPILENHSLFPKRTNVGFVQVIDKNTLKVRVWERGAGETLACGTGACGAAVAAVLNGLTHRKVTVQLRGGNLEINWSEKDNRVYMKGPGVEVFEGEIEI
jgi:diaminopimelate epimerase